MFKCFERKCDTFFRPVIFCWVQVRWKTAKFKPKIARHRPVKTPSALALDNFDFYYGPMYSKRWPSIRVGLLSPHKYIAIVNTFSVSSDASEAILSQRGAFELISSLYDIESSNQERENVRADNNLVDEQPVKSEESAEKGTDNESFPDQRDESGLLNFQPSPKTFTLGEIQSGRVWKKNEDITITGFEGQDFRIPKMNEAIVYPENLKLYVFPRNDLSDFPSPDRDVLGVPTWWLLDGGSIVPVLALNLKQGETMLDMCAAPGGKSLLAAQTLLLDKLVCNDAKLSRLGQLRNALASFIPSNIDIAEKIILKRKNAASVQQWDELESYDKVLVDAPCTTDRLSVNVDDNNIFATSMTTERLNLPQLQTKLLINGLRSLRRGGSLVYSTCSLSVVQNEVVVENAVAIAFEKFGIKVMELSMSQIVTDLSRLGLYRFSKCRYGALILPFLPSNFGPMYFCKLQRTS